MLILVVGVLCALSWTFMSAKDGYKSSQAIILARSISIESTIDGEIDTPPPEVGSQIDAQDLLVRIHNNRIDQSRLIEFESEITFLEDEISNIETRQNQLDNLLASYKQRSDTYTAWMTNDVQLKTIESSKQLEISEKAKELKTDMVQRVARLYQGEYASSEQLNTAKTELDIANSQVELNRAQVKRSELLQRSLATKSVFFQDGDANYWERMIDELTLRRIENASAISSLHAQLNRAKAQVKVERLRIDSSIVEEHRAPFAGIVNATFVNQGSRVIAGTSLVQVLDCVNPIVMVPIPEHRIAEFSVGMKATVYPIDTSDAIPGTIQYISSGPLMATDKTLQIQPELTLKGVHAVVGYDNFQTINDCESAHKAVVVIHTEPVIETAANWLSANF